MKSPKNEEQYSPEAASGEGRGPSLRLALPADRLLTAAARKLGIGKAHYAALAVTYFAEHALDPRVTAGITLAKLHGKLGAEATKGRAYSAAVGDRLAAVLYAAERNRGRYQQDQQDDLLGYLAQIERNILTRLVEIEDQVLVPLLEHVLRNGQEGYLTRALVQKLIVKLNADDLGEPLTSEWHQAIDKYNTSREDRTKTILEKVAAAARLKRPQLTPRPVAQSMPEDKPVSMPNPS